jgi:tight adherence protein B
MVGVVPILIGGSVMAAIALIVYSTAADFGKYFARASAGIGAEIVKADLDLSPEDFVLRLVVASAFVWLVMTVLLRPTLLIALVSFPLAEAMGGLAAVGFLRYRGNARLKKFGDQLEMVLRTISGALRVGVGLRQALVLVADELPDPARREFRRVIGRTNVGIPLVDAIEEMAKTSPGNDLMLFVRCVRVQQQTGGDLASVLETLAATIRDRRRVRRKMSALTAQGRFGAMIIGALPLLVGGFVVATQSDMRDALFYTQVGWACLGGVAVLEGLAIFSLSKILRLDV